MYPFERFTERAKRVLTIAQDEATASGHSYIGTEHLLLGLIREEHGLAAMVLRSLGVQSQAVREAIQAELPVQTDQPLAEQVLPTERIRRVIGLSFEEAREMGHNYVGTEHILLGLLIEGEGVAARLLRGMDVTLDRTRAEVKRLLAEGAREPTRGGRSGMPPPPAVLRPEVSGLVRAAGAIAREHHADWVELDHLLEAVIRSGGTEALSRLLEVRRLAAEKEQLVAAQDYEGATARRGAEQAARAELRRAVDEWRERLQPPMPQPPAEAEGGGEQPQS